MIKKPYELNFLNKKIALLIQGRPGVGKTTVALSAPKPLLIDIENGIDRVEAAYRNDVVTYDSSNPNITSLSYEEIIKTLNEPEVIKNYDTIIIDTLGKLIDVLVPVVIKESGANGTKDGKTLSLKGWGAIKSKVSEFIKFVKSLNKNIIFIAHTTEVTDTNGVIKTRVNIPGSTKDSIWDDIDLGCYIQFVGKDRVIGFSPTETYDAKATHGIIGEYKIPVLKSTKDGGKNSDNHFLTDLFNVYVADLQNDTKTYNKDYADYKEIMDKFVPLIDAIKSPADAEDIAEKLKNVTHALTSREELLSRFSTKIKELNIYYDKEAKQFTSTK